MGPQPAGSGEAVGRLKRGDVDCQRLAPRTRDLDGRLVAGELVHFAAGRPSRADRLGQDERRPRINRAANSCAKVRPGKGDRRLGQVLQVAIALDRQLDLLLCAGGGHAVEAHRRRGVEAKLRTGLDHGANLQAVTLEHTARRADDGGAGHPRARRIEIVAAQHLQRGAALQLGQARALADARSAQPQVPLSARERGCDGHRPGAGDRRPGERAARARGGRPPRRARARPDSR